MNTYFLEETKLDMSNVANCFIELITFLEGMDCSLLYEREYKSDLEDEMKLILRKDND